MIGSIVLPLVTMKTEFLPPHTRVLIFVDRYTIPALLVFCVTAGIAGYTTHRKKRLRGEIRELQIHVYGKADGEENG